MRTVAGLIVGLALGILLMYAAISTVNVGRLSLRPADAGPAVPLPAQPAAVTAPSTDTEPPSLAWRLGNAAGTAAVSHLGSRSTVVVLNADGDPWAEEAVGGFRKAISALPDAALITAATVPEALPRLGDATAVFCPNHALLQALCQQAGERPLPPVYTAGWSEWLVDACAAAHPPVSGVAVVEPAAASRQLTPLGASAAQPAPLATALPVVVMAPASFVTAFTVAENAAASEPAAGKP